MDPDLEAFRAAWLAEQDGRTGDRYAQALLAADDSDGAIAVWTALWELGYSIGYASLAWFERDRGDVSRAIELMTAVVDGYEPGDSDREPALGVIGHWMWHLQNDVAAEPFLRAGLEGYESALSDLAELLRSTGRAAEGESVLRAGVAAGNPDGLLPLGNILAGRGEIAEAEHFYRLGWDSGDAFSAYNLALLLADEDRLDEAEEWMWRAARGGDELAVKRLLEPEPPRQ
jgi:tetratricopeptide (TPR) repeat protein